MKSTHIDLEMQEKDLKVHKVDEEQAVMKKDSSESLPRSRQKLLGCAVCVLLLLVAVGVGFLIWFLTRPSNVPTTFGNMLTSAPSLLKAGETESFGFVKIDSSFDLTNNSNITTYVSITEPQLLSFNTTLVLTTDSGNSTPTSQPDDEGSFFVIEMVENVTFPYMIVVEDDIDIASIVGGFFVDDKGGLIESFRFDIDASLAPVPTPVNPMFVSTLNGRSDYRVEGTVSFLYRAVLDDKTKSAKQIPFIQFQNIITPNAPGPEMYLSKREHKRQGITVEDIFIPIEGTRSGSFSMDGNFWQDLNPSNLDLGEFDSGSIIIWCEPFAVYLGGGPLNAMT